MFGRVLVLRTITASHVATDKTHAQIDPRVARLDAIFANRDIFRVHIPNLVFMGTKCFFHGFSAGAVGIEPTTAVLETAVIPFN